MPEVLADRTPTSTTQSKNKLILGIVGVVVIIVIVVGYIFLQPLFLPKYVEKPVIEKPTLKETEEISAQHVNWIANELGAYQLSAGLTGEDPEIEIILADVGKKFAVTTKDNIPVTKEGEATNPDIRITTDVATVSKIFNTDDFTSEIINQYNQGNLKLDLLKSELTLAAKGYKSIYDQLQQ